VSDTVAFLFNDCHEVAAPVARVRRMQGHTLRAAQTLGKPPCACTAA